MKNKLALFVAVSAILIGYGSPASVATLNLTNGGLGQVAANPQQFGVAVCDNDSQPLTDVVPIHIVVGDQTAVIDSTSSIASGQCEYSYIPYTQFGMEGGKTYAVDVTVSDDHTTYSVTVPPQPNNATSLTANISNSISGLFSGIWNWVVGLINHL